MTKKRLILIVSLTLLIIAGAVYIWKKDADSPIIKETATVQRGSVHKTLDATGIIKAQVGAMIKTGSRFTGYIEKMHVKVGDNVSKGQIIAEIDAREQRTQLAEAEAGLKQAQAEQHKTITSYPLQIQEAKALMKAAQSELEYAELNLARKRSLVERDLDARNSLDQALRDKQVREKTLEARTANLARLQKEFIAEKRRAEEAVNKAQAVVDAAHIRLSYATITSPIDGIVSQVTAPEGETVVAGLQVANLITILDPKRLEMWIYIDETDIGQVKAGQNVSFRIDSQPEKDFHGTISEIYPQPEIRDNIVYYQALVHIPTTDTSLLRPEMTTQCRIIIATQKDTLTVPNAAIKWIDGGRVILVDEGNGKSRTVTPTLGMVGADRTEVLQGVTEGERVATRVVVPRTKQERF